VGDLPPYNENLATVAEKYLKAPSGWRYFAGQQQNGLPMWKMNENDPAVQPLVPFGMFDSDPTDIRYEFHKCLGYFSVRYVQRAKKWVMLYTCDVRPHSLRGVYMRTATLPWGPWSAPDRIFDPSDGYCRFMHLPVGCLPEGCPSGINPFEEEKRHGPNREVGGEYAPFLLPSRYAKPAPNGQTSIYYLMSTGNPYQVVLMRSDVNLGAR
jgi:Domain of unknown function (DUF4185)